MLLLGLFELLAGLLSLLQLRLLQLLNLGCHLAHFRLRGFDLLFSLCDLLGGETRLVELSQAFLDLCRVFGKELLASLLNLLVNVFELLQFLTFGLCELWLHR